jgi:hypothetical protein
LLEERVELVEQETLELVVLGVLGVLEVMVWQALQQAVLVQLVVIHLQQQTLGVVEAGQVGHQILSEQMELPARLEQAPLTMLVVEVEAEELLAGLM